MNPLNESQAAYIAGFWDGEGTIGIWAQRRKDRPMPCYFKVGLSVANTNLQVIEGIQKDLGMGMLGSHRQTNANGKVCYKLSIQQGEAAALLKFMLPFLRIKRRQAEIALAFLGLVKLNGGRGGISESMWMEQKKLYLECGPLNARGVADFVPREHSNATFEEKKVTIPRPYLRRPSPVRTCEYDECGKKHYAKGMCFHHYRKAHPEIYGYKKKGAMAVRGKITCPVCGKDKEFYRRTPSYCSSTCRNRARKMRDKDSLP